MSDETGSNPFVGLRPFESTESLLFFGRQEQTLELLQRLHQHHFVAVIGNSGSGKSSLVRAGLIPKLQAGYLVNEKDRWVISIMKPGQTPICNLADALLGEPSFMKANLTSTTLEEKIKEEGVDAVLEILQPLWATKTNLFLLVDQFEELFRFSLRQKDFEKKDEAKDFVNILLALADQKDLPIYVVTTMRSDFIGDCALIYGLPEAMNKSQYIVPRLNRLQLRNTIEGPVRLYNGKINAALTARLLNDIQLINDELPLLQHVLMRTWDYEQDENKNGELDIDDYTSVGSIENALSIHAEEALEGMTAEELQITKKMFQALTAVDENGRKIRRPARLSELILFTRSDNQQLLSIINRFIEDNRSFLVLSKILNSDDYLIDISHESLIRQWGTLRDWVDKEAEAAGLFSRLTESARLYQKGEGDLLPANELQRVLEWRSAFKPDVSWANRYSNDAGNTFRFLQESEEHQQALQKEKERQQLQKRRNRRLLIAGLLVVIFIISGFAYATYRSNIRNKKLLAQNYGNRSQTARGKGDMLESLLFTAEAISISPDKELIKNLLIDIDPFLPQASLQKIHLLPGIVLGAVFHPDNKRIAVAANDGSVRIMEEETGKTIGKVMMHEAPVYSVAFSPDGNRLITASNDNTAKVWDVNTGQAILTLFHSDAVIDARFNHDGSELLTACADGYARLWEAATGRQIAALKHGAVVTSVSFSPDNKRILTAGKDSTARLWDLETKKQVAEFRHNSVLTTAAFSNDGTRFLTAGHDSTVRIWDAATIQLIILLKNTSDVNAAAFSPDNKEVLTADKEGYARFWNVATGWRTGAPIKHEGPVYSIAYSADGKRILSAGYDRALRLWQRASETSASQQTVFQHNNIVNTVAFNSGGTRLVSASYDSTARIWDLTTQKQVALLQHSDAVTSAVFSPNGKYVVTTSAEGILSLWKASGEKDENAITLNGPLAKAVYSPDWKMIATADAARHVYFFDATTLKRLDSFTYQAKIKSLAFSPDGKNILIAGLDSTARIVNLTSKQIIASFRHRDVVNNAVFSADGTEVLTASYDNTARLWNAATGEQIGPPIVHNAAVKTAFFSPDGKWIVTTSFDQTTRVSDAVTKEVRMQMEQKEGMSSAVFSPDGKKLATAGGDGRVFLWEVPGDLDIPADLFKLQAMALTGVSLDVETGETKYMFPQQWKPLQAEYYEKGKEHYKSCQYRPYNLWQRFYVTEAKALRQ